MGQARRNVLKSGLLLAGGVALPSVARAAAESNALMEQFAARLSAHDIDGFAALFDDGYVNHQVSAATPPPPQGMTPKQGSVAFFKARLVGMPDLKVTIEAQLAADDKVAASFVYQGTHGGTYFGMPPTGKPLRFTSCDIFRVRNGKLAEHWGMGDLAGVLAQLKG
ncbi:ester cyclase [Methylocella sp. CPCC 101449]|uniref:ester cyclase n=1 Tax=Methylocella sp. CPCC 101449 TaxID=2987531 RepID=UPI00288EDC7E|nr:ester cyclase [Methylocella sp. CPCC 101449]MDT2023924.1 ester cyclase [Methylocella sp. CPCC 101449]